MTTEEQAFRRRLRNLSVIVVVLATMAVALVVANSSHAQRIAVVQKTGSSALSKSKVKKVNSFDAQIVANANNLFEEGRNTFRFDTFGDEAFWGGELQLHEAIKGAALGGVGPGISPTTALTLGLKVDVDALPQPLINQLKQGKVNLNDPANDFKMGAFN